MNENEIYIDQAIENYLTETNISGLIPGRGSWLFLIVITVIHNDNSMQTQDKVRMAIFILLPVKLKEADWRGVFLYWIFFGS